MIEKSKHGSEAMKKLFNKELVLTREDNEDFENSVKCSICDSDYVDDEVKVRDHCHITEKCRSSALRDCNNNVKLNHKIPAVLQKVMITVLLCKFQVNSILK